MRPVLHAAHTGKGLSLRQQSREFFLRIGIDLMGSGIDPQEAASAIKESLFKGHLCIYAASALADYMHDEFKSETSISVISSEDYIRMDEQPVRAVLNKPDSSLVRSFKDLGEGRLDALVTLGSTGSVITASKLYLKPLPQVKRPFLLAVLPSIKDPLIIADVGGTVAAKLTYFKDLALVSAAYFRAENKGTDVKLGLLNIGEEATKGTGVHKEAFFTLGALIESLKISGYPISFLGNIEPHNAFSGVVNVLITDGFTGNIFLKTAEGAAEFILKQNKSAAFDSSEYSGAYVAGVDALVIKCHGHSNKKALTKGIERAERALENKLLDAVKTYYAPQG